MSTSPRQNVAIVLLLVALVAMIVMFTKQRGEADTFQVERLEQLVPKTSITVAEYVKTAKDNCKNLFHILDTAEKEFNNDKLAQRTVRFGDEQSFYQYVSDSVAFKELDRNINTAKEKGGRAVLVSTVIAPFEKQMPPFNKQMPASTPKPKSLAGTFSTPKPMPPKTR